jgi:hypothetical protein
MVAKLEWRATKEKKGDAAIRQDFQRLEGDETMHLLKKDEPRAKRILILQLNYSIGIKTKHSYGNDALHSENNVYVYFRYNNNETVISMNNSTETKTIKPIVLKKTSKL